MSIDIPRKVVKLWEKGLQAKERGQKEEAMKEFLGYYDMINFFLQSDTSFSRELLKTHQEAVEKEIQELLLDEEYLKITTIPEEGIVEIKAAVGLGDQEGDQLCDQYDLLHAPIYVKCPQNRMLEVEQLTLVEYQNEKCLSERVLKMKLLCEGRTAEFVYDRVYNDPITLQGIAERILESTGANFNQNMVGDTQIIIQTNYPSLRNLLEDYLVRGGWIPPEEADQIEVIGYPSKKTNHEELFGLNALKESLPNRKSNKKKPPRSAPKKAPPFRPRRRR